MVADFAVFAADGFGDEGDQDEADDAEGDEEGEEAGGVGGPEAAGAGAKGDEPAGEDDGDALLEDEFELAPGAALEESRGEGAVAAGAGAGGVVVAVGADQPPEHDDGELAIAEVEDRGEGRERPEERGAEEEHRLGRRVVQGDEPAGHDARTVVGNAAVASVRGRGGGRGILRRGVFFGWLFRQRSFSDL